MYGEVQVNKSKHVKKGSVKGEVPIWVKEPMWLGLGSGPGLKSIPKRTSFEHVQVLSYRDPPSFEQTN